jgi:hypothetical protein
MIYRGYDIEVTAGDKGKVEAIVYFKASSKATPERCKSFTNEQAAMDAIDFHLSEKGKGR